MSGIKKYRKGKKMQEEAAQLHMNRDIESLAALKDTPYNRDLVEKFAKAHAILSSGKGDAEQRTQAILAEEALWRMLQIQLAGVDA